MKRLFLFLTFIPICATADFGAVDSSNLDLARSYLYSINNDTSSYLPYLSQLASGQTQFYNLFYDPTNGLDGHNVLFWTCTGSKVIYDFLGGTSIVNFPAIDSLRVLSSTSPDSAPAYNLWSYQSQTAPDFKSFLHGYVNRHFPLMYSLSSGVSDLDARAWRLQNQGAYITNSLSRGIGSSWTYAAWPSISTLLSSPFDSLNSNPLNFTQYAQSVPFDSSPDFTSSAVNFWKWYIEKYSASRDLYDSSSFLQDRAYYNISTNYFDFARRYDVALSNIVEGIRADNKKSSDVFSNLWTSTFHLPYPASTLSYLFHAPSGRSSTAWPDSTTPTQLSFSIPRSDSVTHLIFNGFYAIGNYFQSQSKYLWSYLVHLQRLNDKLDSLPSALASSLSSIDVTIDNPTVHVTVDNPTDISATFDTSYTPVYGYDIADTGYIYSDINPGIDKGMPDSTLLHSLTGDFFSDSIVVLQTLSKQHTTLNVATISILTNVQVIADYLRGDDHSDPDYTTDKSDIDSQISGASFINFGDFDELDSNYRFTTHLGFAENVYLPDIVEVDFSSIYDITYSFFKVRQQVKVDDLIFNIDISKYHWFFKLMRGASIVLIVIFNIQLYILLGRVFLWLLSVVFKSICTNS